MSSSTAIGSCMFMLALTTVKLMAQPWTFTNTGNSAIVVITLAANPTINNVPLSNGDYIGVFFDSAGTKACGGYSLWTGQNNISVAAFGDDALTAAKDGFAAGEAFQWKTYRASDGKQFNADVTYVPVGGIITNAGTFTVDGISQVQSFFSALPVELVSFTADTKEHSVVLHWITATEVDNYGFEVEKMISGRWEKIGFVNGNGTSNVKHSYAHADTAITQGAWMYRLKQIDRNGNFEYSREITAVIDILPSTFSLGQNYPNPFNPVTQVRYTLPQDSRVTIRLYDIVGREVATLIDAAQQAGTYALSIDGTSLSSGVYHYVMHAVGTTSVFTETRRMVLIR